jgi:uncharacterized protein
MDVVLITGGTGLIGRELTRLLMQRGFEVIIVTRDLSPRGKFDVPAVSYMAWNIREQTIDERAIRKADYVIHLAGAGVADRRWTRRRKREIVESRTKSSELLVKSLQEIPNRVRAVISASAIGWYDASSASRKTETDPPANDFLGNACRLWEESIDPVSDLGKRLVKIRIGIVLCNEGGALVSFRKPIRYGIAAILGSGKQMVSWIHIGDICRIFLEAITDNQYEGVYNGVAPNPVSNRALTLQLAKKMKGSFFIPLNIPGFLLKAVLGEMSIEVLKSSLISADKIRKTGFQFLCPTIDSVLSQEP